jgi:hypothetical protein
MEDRAAFQIRDFSISLRKEIVEEADANRQSVGEFMTAVCLAAREQGWLRAVVPQNGMSNVKPAELTALIQIATADGLPRYLRRGAARQIAARIGITPPHLRLAAPADDEAQTVKPSLDD